MTKSDKAFEIEQLRAERDCWRNLARQLYNLISETSSRAFYRANILGNFEDLSDAEFLQAMHGE